MSRNEEQDEENNDIVTARYTTAPEDYLEVIPSNSTAARGQKPLPPAPTACKGDYDNDCVYEVMTGN